MDRAAERNRVVYIGIDVACAAGKRLPLCAVSGCDPITPLKIPAYLSGAIPRGLGNREIVAPAPFQKAALDVATALVRIADEMEWRIARVAIDAPAAPPRTGSRASEDELGLAGISCIRTPSVAGWVGIRCKCVEHLESGRDLSTLPHANKVWMLYGFELFAISEAASRPKSLKSTRPRLSAHCWAVASISQPNEGTTISSWLSPAAPDGTRQGFTGC
jgi:hypothetical protein